MISSTRLREVLSNWDIPDKAVQTIVQTEDGNIRENTRYVGRDHVLKVFSAPGPARANASVMKALEASGLCGGPVKTHDGEDILSDGELYFLLTTRVRGEEFDPELLFGPEGGEHACYLGRCLGLLHKALAVCPDIACGERNIYRKVCDCWLTPAAEHMGLPASFREAYRDFGTLHDALPVQVIHRDPNLSNILLRDGKLAGFIDFDLTQRSIRLFDPCYAATSVLCGLFQRGKMEQLAGWIPMFRALLRGYDEVVHMTEAEKQAVPWVVLSIELICVGYFSAYDKFHALAQTNMDMLRWLMEHREELGF